MILGRSKPKPETPSAETPAAAPETLAAAPISAPQQAVRPRDASQNRMAQSFAQVVAVLMRDPNFKKLPLGDLEWLVLPPLMAGQFRLAHLQANPPGDDKQPGMLVPVGVALWARVSAAIDQRLTENLDQPVRLQAHEWVSGDNIWLMVAAGDQRMIPAFIQQLKKTEFRDKQVKLRRRGADGKVVIATLGQAAA